MTAARLCLATDSREPSGVGEHMLVLADALRHRFEIVLACPDGVGGAALLGRAGRLGIGVKRLEGDREAAARWMRRMGFDLLHVHAGVGWEGHDLAAAGRAAGVARIVRTEHLSDVITDPAQRLQHAAGVALVDRLVCVSGAVAASFAAVGIPEDRLLVIRNGLRDRPPARSREAVRWDLGEDLSRPVLLTAARFTPQKGHAVLIEALPAILARHPALRVWLAGHGPLENDIRREVGERGLGEVVRFLGQRDDVPDLLAAADLFVLPSRFEGLPLAALEAMAASRPVVATRVGGTDEAVLDGVTGRLVEPDDPGGLGAAIAAVLARPEEAARFGAAGRERFLGAFTASRMADETARLYSRLGVMPQQRSVAMHRGPDAKTRIAFIGAGGIAHRHLGVLEGFADVEIAAFADPAIERAQAAAERFGAAAFADLEAMLDAQPLDALYICVPPFAHGAPERAALARRLPFFVEKPVSLDLADAEAIARAVEAGGLITAVGYHWRYLDIVEEVARLLADNPAQFLSGYWLDATPPPPWWWKQDGSGGQMNEQTTHLVDLARVLAGDVVQVFGLASHKPRPDFPGLDIATASTASLRFASGAIGNMGSTCLLRWNHRVGLHLFGDGLAVELTDHDVMIDVGRGRPVRHAEGDPVWREDRDFIDAVRGGENRIRCPYGEALKTLRVTDAIHRSADTGRAIDLSAQPAETAHV